MAEPDDWNRRADLAALRTRLEDAERDRDGLRTMLDELSGACRDYFEFRQTQVAGELYRTMMERTDAAREALKGSK